MPVTTPFTLDGLLGDELPKIEPRSPRVDEPQAAASKTTATNRVALRIKVLLKQNDRARIKPFDNAETKHTRPWQHRRHPLFLGGTSVRGGDAVRADGPALPPRRSHAHRTHQRGQLRVDSQVPLVAARRYAG